VQKEEGQAYAQVIKMLGNGRLEAMCFDGQKRLCHIRGKLRKKVWINTTDIILIGLREFQDEKADVILKYTPDEARQLKTRGEIPENVNIMDTSQFGQEAGGDDIYFNEESDDDDAEGGVGGAKAYDAANLLAGDDDDDEDGGSAMPAGGNLNRRNNNMTVTRDFLEDMTDSDETDEEEDE